MFSRELLFLHKCRQSGYRGESRTLLARGTSGVVSLALVIQENFQSQQIAFSLYRHISSNNIGMTAPVETRYPVSTLEAGEMGAPNERGDKVSFLYRNTDIYSGHNFGRSS